MSILSMDHLGLSFGAFDLFKGISASIANDSKIGLIGPNGVGKTSLLLILAGINAPTSGQVNLAKNRRIGYLRQEAVDAFASRHNTVYGEMLTVFENLHTQQDHLNELEARMASGQADEATLEEYGRAQEAFDKDGGYDFDIRIQQTLEGLGLGKKHWETPLNQLSGGQKTRALLARLLLEKPDLLMLDEPTNHLDIEAVEWLERTLHEWEGAVLIVSHDRYFLDSTVNTLWEMSPTHLEEYKGNYSAYLVQRVERWEYTERIYTEEKERLLKEVDFIQRNWIRASTHARALGRLRQITRDLSIVENYGILALRSGKKWSEYDTNTIRGTEHRLDPIEAVHRVNAISLPSNHPHQIKPHLPEGRVSGTIVLRAENALIGYPGNPLFTVKSLELRRGEYAVLIGPNGAGKTTFLKVLLGQMQPLQGVVELGASLRVGYFAQAHDALKGTHSVMDELIRHKSMEDGAARSHLAQYLFRGEDVFKPLDALSGGERARLALAILALEGANFLLLDEPTNHLDIPAREALQEVLESYTGTILLVSHDRYLIDRLATQIWNLQKNQLTIFKGGYRDFILRQATGLQAAQVHKMMLPSKPMVRDNSKETKRRTEALSMIEERIREQETAIQRLSAELQRTNGSNYDRLQKLSWQLAQSQAKLESLMGEWEKLAV